MNYTIRQVDDKTIFFDFLPKNVALSLFLQGDFTAFQEDILRLIDNVLDGESADCQIPTKELRSLMDEWIAKTGA